MGFPSSGMNFRVPIYVFQHPGVHRRPLFFPPRAHRRQPQPPAHQAHPRICHARSNSSAASRGTTRLGGWAFCPRVTTHRVALEIELRRRIARVKYLVVAFDHMGRRLAFTPAVPDLWFEVTRNEPLEVRAARRFTEHWRKAERDADEDEDIRPEDTGLSGKAWVQVLELSAARPRRRAQAAADQLPHARRSGHRRRGERTPPRRPLPRLALPRRTGAGRAARPRGGGTRTPARGPRPPAGAALRPAPGGQDRRGSRVRPPPCRGP